MRLSPSSRHIVRSHVPRDPWLTHPLREEGLAESWEGTQFKAEMLGVLRCIVVLEDPKLHSLLLHNNDEADWIRRSLQLPLDSVIFNIAEVWIPQMFHGQQALYTTHAVGRHNMPVPVASRGQGKGGVFSVWRPYHLRVAESQLFTNLRGVQCTFLQPMRSIEASTYWSPLCENGFCTLPVLQVPGGIPPALLGSIPEASLTTWVAETQGRNEEPKALEPVRAAGLEDCARFIRTHSSLLLSHDDDEHNVLFPLHQCLSTLDNAVRSLTSRHAMSEAMRRTQFNAFQLWSGFSICELLRDKKRLLEKTLRHALLFTFPGLAGAEEEVFRDMMGRVPSPSTLRRCGLMLDTAMMLTMRDRASADVLRFGWADSSPQGGRDWLLVVTDSIKRDRVLQVVAAANTLALLGSSASHKRVEALSKKSTTTSPITPLLLPTCPIKSRTWLAKSLFAFTNLGWNLALKLSQAF